MHITDSIPTLARVKLHTISAKDALRALAKKGYSVDHQTGSHIILRQSWPPYRRLTIPNHKELAKGTLRSIIRQAGLTVEEFLELL
ncbi:MAG TPA: type II toxin-antitoxin system HicA family toxin [Candidatus Acidoferrales bacterium]|nr:type II toxin-antitoxin system HicA family toxin [Candidatus Acidoferrales bacterium]